MNSDGRNITIISNWTFSRFVIIVLLVALAALIAFTNFNYGKTMIVLQVCTYG